MSYYSKLLSFPRRDATEWSLQAKDMRDEDAVGLAELLASDTTLTHLDISFNFIAATGAKAIAKALHRNTVLQHLIISDNKVGTEGAKGFAIALHHNCTLRQLDLAWNSIGIEGAVALSEALLINATLQHLQLSHNNIGPDGGVALAEALQHNTTLHHLNITGNQVGDEGAKALAVVIKRNTTLQHLDITDNYIGGEGAKALAEALLENTTLVQLDVAKNNMAAAGTKSAAAALQRSTALQQLAIAASKEVRSSIDTSLQRNKFIRSGSLSISAEVASSSSAGLALALLMPANKSGLSLGTAPCQPKPEPSLAVKQRMTDVTHEDGRTRCPLIGLFERCSEVLPIDEALRPVAHLIPYYDVTLRLVKDKADEVLFEHTQYDGLLDANMVAYVLFYTVETWPAAKSLSTQMAKALREAHRTHVAPYVDYIWGLLQALKRLPPSPHMVLYRGCAGPLEDMGKNYVEGRQVTWAAFSSCSESFDVQRKVLEPTGYGVIFELKMKTAVARDVRHLSWYDETEIILPPGVRFQIQRIEDHGDGIKRVQLLETSIVEMIVDFCDRDTSN